MSKIATLTEPYSWCEKKQQWPVECEVGPGLSGLIADYSPVAWVDSMRGTLEYRGVSLSSLVESPDFEAVACLLIYGQELAESHLDEFRLRVREARDLPDGIPSIIACANGVSHPTQVLRAGISAVGCYELRKSDALHGRSSWKELRILGQIVSLAGLITCRVTGEEPTTVNHSSSLAEGVFEQIRGSKASECEVRLLNLLWILYADHGLDAPTFTSMIVGSCHADPYYNVVAGLSALHGDRLGRAGETLLNRIKGLKSEQQLLDWVNNTLDDGGKIPGFGHRFHHFADPRVEVLKSALCNQQFDSEFLELLHRFQLVEHAAAKRLQEKNIHVNINFYSALVLHYLKIPSSMVASFFMIGRMAGLIARVKEYLRKDGRLFRPLCEYTGEEPRRIGGES